MKRTPIKRKTPLKRGNKPLKRTPLNPMSKNPNAVAKRSLYAKNKATYMKDNPRCEICARKGKLDLHHKAGRTGDNYTNIATFMAVCRMCHDWIHSHPKESREKGYLI